MALVDVKITHWSMLASRRIWSSRRFLWFLSSQYNNCSSILPCLSSRSISITSGFLVSLRASLPTAPSQVAENSSVWRSSGVAATMVSMSSMKPMSSMRSASSKISTSSRSKSTRPLRMWSISRPGVATIMSIGLLIALICWPKDEPPTSVTERTHFMFLAYICAFFSTCAANSRVGVSTKTRGPLPGFSLRFTIFCRLGSRNAAVLPEPVCALAIMSLPASAAGMDCA